MTNGVVCVPKPDKSIRLCCGYRYLNTDTVPDSTSMKLVSECVYKVAQAKFVLVCNAKSVFWQLLVQPQDRWKCEFVTHHEVYTNRKSLCGVSTGTKTNDDMLEKNCNFCM